MKILVVVPAYNEEQMIGSVINDLKKHGYKNIIVVDDGSSDNTGEKVKLANVKLLHHISNRGLGAAIGTGFEYAKKTPFDALVTFDSDGQHQAKDISRLLEPIIKGNADVVIGSRFKDYKNIPFPRLLANLLSNFATLMICGVWTTDSQSGLRALSNKAVKAVNLKTDRMEVSSEFFREISTKNLIFKEIPIQAIYTDYSLKGSKQGNIALSSVKIGINLLIRLFR